MAQLGSSCESEEKRASLKRKRNTTEHEDLENMPPTKILPKYEAESEEPVYNVVVESSPCSSDDEGSPTDLQPSSNYTELEYNPDGFLSPPSLSEPTNCVLSPLENVSRGESTPHSNKRPSKTEPPPPKRRCPLPGLSWADPIDVWKNLCDGDVKSARKRNPNMFDNHPQLQSRMRAILLDWLNEVSEVYKLHRETFHLTVEFVDRYLTNTEDVKKGQLQLIGITCLFIAAKVEEVYPPKIGEFAYVTDGACTTEEILLQELNILNVLSWSITPVTINGWLNIYMQLSSESRSAQRRLISECDSVANALRGYTFVFPQYSSLEFVICGQLIDLAVLHVDVNKYAYSVVAAAAMAHIYNKELAMRVSGFNWDALESCYWWLSSSAGVVRAAGGVCIVRGGGEQVGGCGGLHDICPDLNADDAHRIQVHNVTLDMFNKVEEILEQTSAAPSPPAAPSPSSPLSSPAPAPHLTLPTPPRSDHKSPAPSTNTPSTRHIQIPTDVE